MQAITAAIPLRPAPPGGIITRILLGSATSRPYRSALLASVLAGALAFAGCGGSPAADRHQASAGVDNNELSGQSSQTRDERCPRAFRAGRSATQRIVRAIPGEIRRAYKNIDRSRYRIWAVFTLDPNAVAPGYRRSRYVRVAARDAGSTSRPGLGSRSCTSQLPHRLRSSQRSRSSLAPIGAGAFGTSGTRTCLLPASLRSYLVDLCAVRDQQPLFGPVASDVTAFRVIDESPAILMNWHAQALQVSTAIGFSPAAAIEPPHWRTCFLPAGGHRFSPLG